jgi:hypothetical protein
MGQHFRCVFISSNSCFVVKRCGVTGYDGQMSLGTENVGGFDNHDARTHKFRKNVYDI